VWPRDPIDRLRACAIACTVPSRLLPVPCRSSQRLLSGEAAAAGAALPAHVLLPVVGAALRGLVPPNVTGASSSASTGASCLRHHSPRTAPAPVTHAPARHDAVAGLDGAAAAAADNICRRRRRCRRKRQKRHGRCHGPR
jgi:hypothetical protein